MNSPWDISTTAPRVGARRWLPHPALSLFMLVFWLLLVNSITVGQLLLGAFLAWLIPWLTQSFWPESLRIRKPFLLVKYVLLVLWDVVIANLVLVVRILGPVNKLQPVFMKVPLDIHHQFTITIFASTISLTPGTVSADLSLDGKYLLVHSLHETDPEAAIVALKQRYEAPLKEVFECSPQP
ncbi:Na+/H+ antiporter subunit E [Cellvibrio japonicus]|uniref:PhaE protein n=1 Tax=Cellvibrio japonicus (strain Ueda107) TaxID=498211 RepID=B3PFD3_CELJU|nr:Na+/H+ antiporter subunit E [Cellvibrio japonicus]ACE85509.1 PhaE protein [Cellvibrio japonicus Ueda107]QEI10806.1 Na+/H+ antiporter subunit E [Cellvibrio japonicus]QEI14382.1 Na+/H+ antiporter subunit E [Cellvibrio japonicus]QEI17960.1 Na+/H+ antiporter subunit E [Cellvibrio japonicus]